MMYLARMRKLITAMLALVWRSASPGTYPQQPSAQGQEHGQHMSPLSAQDALKHQYALMANDWQRVYGRQNAMQNTQREATVEVIVVYVEAKGRE